MGKDNKSVAVENITMLVRNLQSAYDCLQFDSKRIKPAVDALLGLPMSETNLEADTIATKDMVNRLSRAESQLSEAMCMIQDAISSITIGCKNFKGTQK